MPVSTGMMTTTRALVVTALFVGYLLLGFVVRSYLQYRRTGSTGFRGISGPALSAGWFGGVLFVGALVATLATPLLAWLGLDRLVVAPSLALDIAGAIAVGAGTVMLLWSQGAMGTSWRIGVDANEVTALVTRGPFGLVRNPIFTGILVSAAGLAMVVPSVTALIALVALFAAIELQVRFVEEPYLARMHGATYVAYTRRVGRFVPGLGALTG